MDEMPSWPAVRLFQKPSAGWHVRQRTDRVGAVHSHVMAFGAASGAGGIRLPPMGRGTRSFGEERRWPPLLSRLETAATPRETAYAVPGSPRTAALGSRPSAGDQGAFGMGTSCTALPASDRQYVAASLRISASGLAPVRAKTA